MENSMVVVDRQSRIYLPKRFKERPGSRFFAVKLGDEIRLVPIPKDPAADLARLGKKLPRASIKQLKKDILTEAGKVS